MHRFCPTTSLLALALAPAIHLLALSVSAHAQGPNPATVPIELNADNSTLSQPATFLDPAALDGLGFHGYPIDELFVINAIGGRDNSLRSQPVDRGCNAYDAVANGTFFETDPIRPISPLVRQGGLDRHDANPFALRRGAVAVLDDGTIVVDRTDGLSGQEIGERFGSDLREFMGGGILLIEDGAGVDLRDIVFSQYVQNRSRANANKDWEDLIKTSTWPDQCRPTSHTVIAIRQGQAYLLVAKKANCREIRDRLLKEGFGSAVMFDGGRATYLKEAEAKGSSLRLGDPQHDVNVTGIGIYQRHAGQESKAARCSKPPKRCGLGAPPASQSDDAVTFDYAPGSCEMEPVEPLAAGAPAPVTICRCRKQGPCPRPARPRSKSAGNSSRASIRSVIQTPLGSTRLVLSPTASPQLSLKKSAVKDRV